MGSPSTPTDSTTSTVTEIPEEVQPYLTDFLQRTDALSRTPFSEYQGERISPLSGYHDAAADLVTSRALYGDPAVEAGRGMLAGALSGNYFNDPAYKNAFDRNADLVQGRAGAMFGSQGLTNAGVREATTRQLNDLATTMADAERSRMPQFAQLALGYGEEPYQAAQRVLGVGDMYRQFDQDQINEAIRSFEAQRMHPFQMADVAGNALRMGMGSGGTVTQTSPGFYEPSGTANLIGGGMLGYGLANEANPNSFFGQNPWLGGAGGAAAGYLGNRIG